MEIRWHDILAYALVAFAAIWCGYKIVQSIKKYRHGENSECDGCALKSRCQDKKKQLPKNITKHFDTPDNDCKRFTETENK